jgi:hypothetical protein
VKTGMGLGQRPVDEQVGLQVRRRFGCRPCRPAQ